MVALDYIVPQTYTEKLRVPPGLSPSNPVVRGWIISPSGNQSPVPLWITFATCIPAMLVYILLFMETHICEYVIHINCMDFLNSMFVTLFQINNGQERA